MVEESSLLILDGSSDIRITLSSIPQTYCILSSSNAKQTLEYLRVHRFDLVIMELELPDMDGLCLLSILRRVYPQVPVLILTRDLSLNRMIKALQLGARGYLHKPCDSGEVSFCVIEILKEGLQNQQRSIRPRAGKIRPARMRREILNEWDEVL